MCGSLKYLSRWLFLQDKLQRTLDLFGLGGSFIMPDADGLSKCFINQCITIATQYQYLGNCAPTPPLTQQ